MIVPTIYIYRVILFKAERLIDLIQTFVFVFNDF